MKQELSIEVTQEDWDSAFIAREDAFKSYCGNCVLAMAVKRQRPNWDPEKVSVGETLQGQYYLKTPYGVYYPDEFGAEIARDFDYDNSELKTGTVLFRKAP